MNQEELNKLITRYLSGECSQAEIEKLNSWYNSLEKGEKLIVEGQSEDDIRNKVWNQILCNTKIDNSRSLRTSQHTGFKKIYRYAAVVAFLVIFSGLWFLKDHPISLLTDSGTEVTIETKAGQRKHVLLPDGSSVWLNSVSNLTFDKDFEAKVRRVKLSGEAFFDVKRDEKRPFIVQTDNLSTTVLGTSFNVRSYPTDSAPQVAVVTGKVLVKSLLGDSKANTVLVANQKVKVDPDSKLLVKSTDSNAASYSAWKEGTLVFDETPMKEVLETLSRRFDVEFKIKNEAIYNCLVFGTYKDQSLENLLGLLTQVTDSKYDLEGKEVYLYGQGCPE